MRLLFDQNLSYRLVDLLADPFPDSEHVRNIGLAHADDIVIWEHAKKDDYVIVTKDFDFHQLSFLFGHPPKVIWLRLGNCSTADIEAALRNQTDRIQRFFEDETESLLAITRGTV